MALKSIRIVDFCGKLSGFADFDSTVDRGSAVNLTWIPDCACHDVRILRLKQNLDYRSFFSLGRYVNEFIQIISFFKQSSLKLKCETFNGIILC